jgi:uncharacterized protein (TIGR00661 family)
MKILYAIQGTGNGHMSRAVEIIPLLLKRCETDILVSGYQTDLGLPFEVKFRLQGLSFIFGKKGGIDLRRTYQKANTRKLLQEIKDLPVENYDFVLNDFEPVSAWACYRKKVPCIALSHQSSLLDKKVPRPKNIDSFGSFILKNYAPASFYLGLHFSSYSKNIYTPVVRRDIREAEKSDQGHYTVYLPAYDDNTLIGLLGKIPDVNWQIFSKHNHQPLTVNNITVQPVDNHAFQKSLIACKGVLCGAGFETPAEALYLGKKLMVIPMQNQYEQQYNAAALKELGVPVIKKLKDSKIDKVNEWVHSGYRVEIHYPDVTESMVEKIFEMYEKGKFTQKGWRHHFKLVPTGIV